MSSEVRSEPNMIVHANDNIVSKRGLPLVCFKCGSASPLPVAEEVSSKFQSAHPVCQECFAKGVCVRTRGQKQMRTWLPHWVTDLAWTLRCVWSQLKIQKSVLLRACDQMLCEGIGIFLGGEIIFFSVRSVAFLRKMWRETEIKITVALWKALNCNFTMFFFCQVSRNSSKSCLSHGFVPCSGVLEDNKVDTWILIGDPSRLFPGILCAKYVHKEDWRDYLT